MVVKMTNSFKKLYKFIVGEGVEGEGGKRQKKWSHVSFLSMFGLKAKNKVRPEPKQAGAEGKKKLTPSSIMVTGSKEQNFKPELVRSSDLKQLRSLFVDIDTDADGMIDYDEFCAAMSSNSLRGDDSVEFQRDIFDRISDERGLCAFDSMLGVLYPGATKSQLGTMMAMSKPAAAGATTIRQAKSGSQGPQAPVSEAAKIFKTYDKDSDGRVSEEEFVSGMTATGVYTEREALREFNRMDHGDKGYINLKDFTMWYVAMEDIVQRQKRNA